MLVRYEVEGKRVSRLEAERNQSQVSPLPWAQVPPGTPLVAHAWAWGWWSLLRPADNSYNLRLAFDHHRAVPPWHVLLGLVGWIA